MHSETPRPSDTRDSILKAAMAILSEGKELLTLDSVMRQASVSKADLLHHFPDKDRLVQEVVAELIRIHQDMMADRLHAVPSGRDRPLTAYVESSLDPLLRVHATELARGIILLYGSDLRKDHRFLDPWREAFSTQLERFRQQGNSSAFARAAIITLTLECLTLIDVFDLHAFTDAEMDLIKEELLSLTSTCEPS